MKKLLLFLPLLFLFPIDSSAQTISSGLTTKVINATTTTTIAHGLGVEPELVRIKGMFGEGSNQTWEGDSYVIFVNGSQYGLNRWVEDNVSGSGFSNDSQLFRLGENSANIEGTISVDDTNITITWVKNGTPSGWTFNLLWEAYAPITGGSESPDYYNDWLFVSSIFGLIACSGIWLFVFSSFDKRK